MSLNPRTFDWNKILEYGDFKKTDKVLETGAMFGLFSLELSPLVDSVLVTDSYDWAERRFVNVDGRNLATDWENAIYQLGNLSVEMADVQELPYPDNSFDKVVCISTIEHVPDDRKAITEMMRVLKPGGLLLITTEYNPTEGKMVADPDGSFYRVYTSKEIDKLVEGFEVVRREAATETPINYTTIFLALTK